MGDEEITELKNEMTTLEQEMTALEQETYNEEIIILQERMKAIGKENRPQIAQPIVDRFNKHLTNSEISSINRIYHQDNVKKKKTIFDLKLGTIMENTSNFFNVFLTEYQNKIYDTELYYTNKNAENNLFENLKIYIIAFVRYVTESDNIIYLGIILILISIILYFLNIINIKKDE